MDSTIKMLKRLSYVSFAIFLLAQILLALMMHSVIDYRLFKPFVWNIIIFIEIIALSSWIALMLVLLLFKKEESDAKADADADDEVSILDIFLFNRYMAAKEGRLFRTAPLLTPFESDHCLFREVKDQDEEMLQKVIDSNETTNLPGADWNVAPVEARDGRELKNVLLEFYKQGMGFYYVVADKADSPRGICWLSDINEAAGRAKLNFSMPEYSSEDKEILEIWETYPKRMMDCGFRLLLSDGGPRGGKDADR